jgi:tRNA threonylcarbamoyladenosine biosynthesis protein TsaB
MHLLAIETASETVSVALSVNGEVRERYEHAPRQHAELLLPWVEQMLAEAELSSNSLDAIAFSRGPGSFTSLRIGIGVVQGLAWASDIPVIPVSSLAATAQSAFGEGYESVVVALDARMNEVFSCIFEAGSSGIMLPVNDEVVCPPADVVVPENTEMVGIGIGFDRYDELKSLSKQLSGVRADIWPKASSVLTLAENWLETHEALPAEQAQPVYLRDNVAKKTSERIKS